MQAHPTLQQLEKRVRVLTRLTEISLTLNSTLELEPLLRYLMDAAAEVTQSEGASVLLWDNTTHELRFAAITSTQRYLNLIGQAVPLEGSIAGTVLRENRIVQVDNTQADPRHYSKLDEEKAFETRSLLGVPMRLKDQVIGVLEAVNKRELPWTDDDHDAMLVLAAQAAVAIESAQLIAALQKANQELSELDKLKNDFIAIASHELRTPLGVLLGYASFLQDEAEGKASEHAAKVLASGLQLRQIIDSLTNLRYLQQSPGELHQQPTPLKELVWEAAAEVANLVEANRHALDIDLPDGLRVHADPIRLAMALTNVLNNAARFTPPGGHIAVRAEQRTAQEVWIHVEDNGIGIPADRLERIFDKFYQIEDHMTRQHGGLGIGLSIARALVEAHGGRIWASSPGLGQGTTVTLALPLAESLGKD